jgi:hypothetical protein
MLITSRHGLRTKHRCSYCCIQLLLWKHACLRNRYLVTVVLYLIISRSLPSNDYTYHIAPSLRLFVPNSLQMYRHYFFSEGCACDVCDRSRLPSSWLGSHGDCSPTAVAAPFLRPLVPSSSLIRCEPVQMYPYHPRSRVPLDPIYHVIYPRDYRVWALPWGLKLGWLLSCGWADRDICRRPRDSPGSWSMCRNEFSSGHWPTSGVGGRNCGCSVDGPLDLLHDRLLVVPCLGMSQRAGFSCEHQASWGKARKLGGRWVILRPNPSGAMRRGSTVSAFSEAWWKCEFCIVLWSSTEASGYN